MLNSPFRNPGLVLDLFILGVPSRIKDNIRMKGLPVSITRKTEAMVLSLASDVIVAVLDICMIPLGNST
jgi:hypothetical protein